MGPIRLPLAISFVLTLGASAPGCFPSTDSLGRFCASPAEGGEYCVPSTYDPGSAWADAEINGSMPIQMWAEWPEAVTLDEVAGSSEKLHAWLADIDKVVEYVRDTEGSAESYRASLEGKLGFLLGQVRDRQKVLLAQKPVDAVGNFKQALTDKANAEKSPLVAEIASDKQAMAAVRGIFDKAKEDAAPLEETYAGLVKAFSDYRATEEAETAKYAALAKDASAAGLDTLEAVEQAIVLASQEASGKPNDLISTAFKLSASIQQLELASQSALGPHADFMATHGAGMPNMTSGALRSINAMLGYVERRVKRSDATASALVANIVLRRQALVLVDAAPPAKEKASEARQKKASASFAGMASALLAELDGANAKSVKLGLPYLGARYDKLTRLLQMQPLCEKATASFREAGCGALRDRFKAMAVERKTTLPAQITAGIAAMRAKGVDAALLDAAEANLLAGDVKGAALIYDAALRGAEGT